MLNKNKMKLTIDFQIKDGKKIISRDTKGYKVVLNRIVKSFEKINKPDLTYKLVIQMSKEGSWNKHSTYSYTLGQINYEEKIVRIWWNNCKGKTEQETMDKVIETIAHEFGHLYHWLFNSLDFRLCSIIQRENFADKFAKKIVKRELISYSKTGLTKYARRK